MLLHIADNLTLEEVQDHFNECFPSLKISFYSRPQKKFKPANNTELLNEHKLIADVRRLHMNGLLQLKSWFTIETVEGLLKQKFDLNARIFRWDPIQKSWLHTAGAEQLATNHRAVFSSFKSAHVA